MTKVEVLESGYYDDYNLEEIGGNMEEYMERINYYEQFLPDKTFGFWAYKIENGTLVLIDDNEYFKTNNY